MKTHLMRRAVGILSLLLLPLLLLTLASCGVKPVDDRIVVRSGDIKFTYDEFRYFFMNSKEELDGGDDAVWANNEQLREQLTSDLEKRLKRVVAIHQMAEEYDISLGSEEEAVIQEQIEQIKATFDSDEAYQEMLDSEYASEYTLLRMLRTQYLYELVCEYVTDESHFLIRADDETLRADLEANFWRGAQILIRNEEGEDEEENKLRAEEALSKLNAGEDFFKLVEEYGEDPGMKGNRNGYYFTKGALLPYFEEGIRDLAVGEHSGVVECVHGYAIMMRLPMEESYITSHMEELREAMMLRIFEEMLDEATDKIVLETTTLYYQCTVDNMT